MRIRPLFAALALSFALSSPALAADKDYGNRVTDSLTKTECSACHMAFAPVSLPSASWQALMGDLTNHFGEDASVDEATRAHIEAYLVSKSMDGGGTMWGKMMLRKFPKGKTLLRITETPRFKGAHRGGKFRAMAEAKNTTTGANCVVCHKGAPQGVFEEFER